MAVVPSEDLSDCTKELFVAVIGHYKLVRPDFKFLAWQAGAAAARRCGGKKLVDPL